MIIGRVRDLHEGVFAPVFAGDAEGERLSDERPANGGGELARVIVAGHGACAAVPVEARVGGLDRDHPADRVAPLQRALRASIDLNLLQVPDAAVDVYRLVEGQRPTIEKEVQARPGAGEKGIATDRRTGAVDPATRGRAVRPARRPDIRDAFEQETGSAQVG